MTEATKERKNSNVMNINDLGTLPVMMPKGVGRPIGLAADDATQRRRESSSRSRPRRKRRDGKCLFAFFANSHDDADDVARRKINKPTSTVEDPSVLKTYLTTPPVKRIDLHFPLGIDLTARNMKGVTIKDALDTIHKTYKKRVSPQRGLDR